MGLSNAGSDGDWRIVDGEKLYPQKFQDVDMNKLANKWYQRFYRTAYQGTE